MEDRIRASWLAFSGSSLIKLFGFRPVGEPFSLKGARDQGRPWTSDSKRGRQARSGNWRTSTGKRIEASERAPAATAHNRAHMSSNSNRRSRYTGDRRVIIDYRLQNLAIWIETQIEHLARYSNSNESCLLQAPMPSELLKAIQKNLALWPWIAFHRLLPLLWLVD